MFVGEPPSMAFTRSTHNSVNGRLVLLVATGTGAMSETFIADNAYQLDGVELSFDAVPATAQDFVVACDSGDGEAFDRVWFREDPSSVGGDFAVWPNENLYALGTPHPGREADQITFTYDNTDGRSWALRVIFRGPNL